LRLALREIVAERLSKSSANTSNSKKTALAAAKDAYGVRAILPRPEERGLTRLQINGKREGSIGITFRKEQSSGAATH
ncbi:hypothetical protein, partial [Burkholderia anthina]|uniref:hypothetical protein n=1 Tax=Burkholderia anthina TaxID=179879 RepID=UPI001C2EC908